MKAVLKHRGFSGQRWVTVPYPEDVVQTCIDRWQGCNLGSGEKGDNCGLINFEDVGLQLCWQYMSVSKANPVCGAVIAGFMPKGESSFSPQITVSVFTGVDRLVESKCLGDDGGDSTRPLLLMTYNEALLRENAVRRAHDGNNRIFPTDDPLVMGIVEAASVGVYAAWKIIKDRR